MNTIFELNHSSVASPLSMVEKGLDLGDMATMQQVKIEELFLHLIDINKRLQALETENAQLKADLGKIKK